MTQNTPKLAIFDIFWQLWTTLYLGAGSKHKKTFILNSARNFRNYWRKYLNFNDTKQPILGHFWPFLATSRYLEILDRAKILLRYYIQLHWINGSKFKEFLNLNDSKKVKIAYFWPKIAYFWPKKGSHFFLLTFLWSRHLTVHFCVIFKKKSISTWRYK